MKRPLISQTMEASRETIRTYGFALTAFAGWTLDEFQSLIQTRCRWNMTDLGADDYGVCLK